MSIRIVFLKNKNEEIIDEEKTNIYFKNLNQVFANENNDKLVNIAINEIIELCDEVSYQSSFETSDFGKVSPKSAINGVKPKKFNNGDVEEMLILKNKGYSNVKIAKKFKCSEKTIRNYLKGS